VNKSRGDKYKNRKMATEERVARRDAQRLEEDELDVTKVFS